MRISFAILLTTAITVQIKEEEDGPMASDAFADMIMNDTCGEYAEGVYENAAGGGFPEDDDLRALIQSKMDEGLVTGDVEEILEALLEKKRLCTKELSAISPDELASWDCETYIEKGLSLGWISPKPEVAKGLFEINDDQWQAGG